MCAYLACIDDLLLSTYATALAYICGSRLCCICIALRCTVLVYVAFIVLHCAKLHQTVSDPEKFVEYYDLNVDPYNLYNLYPTLLNSTGVCQRTKKIV